jgi:hypothetical protein
MLTKTMTVTVTKTRTLRNAKKKTHLKIVRMSLQDRQPPRLATETLDSLNPMATRQLLKKMRTARKNRKSARKKLKSAKKRSSKSATAIKILLNRKHPNQTELLTLISLHLPAGTPINLLRIPLAEEQGSRHLLTLRLGITQKRRLAKSARRKRKRRNKNVKRRLKSARRRLKNVKRRLKNAKRRLKNAKRRLKNAKRRKPLPPLAAIERPYLLPPILPADTHHSLQQIPLLAIIVQNLLPDQKLHDHPQIPPVATRKKKNAKKWRRTAKSKKRTAKSKKRTARSKKRTARSKKKKTARMTLLEIM